MLIGNSADCNERGPVGLVERARIHHVERHDADNLDQPEQTRRPRQVDGTNVDVAQLHLREARRLRTSTRPAHGHEHLPSLASAADPAKIRREFQLRRAVELKL